MARARTIKALCIGAGIALAGALSYACSVHDVNRSPTPPLAAPLPERFFEGGADGAPVDAWWETFGDPRLDQLVSQVLAGNLDLRRARARVAQAQAIARGADAPLWPRLDLRAGVGGSRTVFNAGEPIGLRSVESASYSIGAAVSYELDLWGRVGHLDDAASLELDASREDLQALGLSLSARVADLWLQIVGERALLELIEAQEDAAKKLVELVELRFAQGLSSSPEVYHQRQSLAAISAQRPLAEARLSVTGHQLAILLGRPPGSMTFGDRAELPAPPPPPPTGIPAELLARRPDVRAAFKRVVAADHRVGAAIAAQYPTLSLSGSTGFQSTDLFDLFKSWVWNLAANILAPIFDGGQRAAEVDRNRAVLEELVSAYGQATLIALGEVEDALVQERRQAEHVDRVQAQLALAQQAHDEARTRYVNGLSSYLEVLTTQRSLQQAEQALLQARRQLLAFRVQLHRALGGTWSPPVGRSR